MLEPCKRCGGPGEWREATRKIGEQEYGAAGYYRCTKCRYETECTQQAFALREWNASRTLNYPEVLW